MIIVNFSNIRHNYKSTYTRLLHVTVNVTVKILEKGRLYEQEKISLGTCSNSIALEAMLLSTSGFL